VAATVLMSGTIPMAYRVEQLSAPSQ